MLLKYKWLITRALKLYGPYTMAYSQFNMDHIVWAISYRPYPEDMVWV